MSKFAYIAELPIDEKVILDGEFLGGDDNVRCDIECRGTLMRGINLRGCFQFDVKATDQLIKSAPDTMVIKNISKTLPDFGYSPWGGLGTVSENVFNILRNIDGDKHQFIPIRNVKDRNGNAINKRYFIMNVHIRINAVNTYASNVKLKQHNFPEKNGIPAHAMTFMSFQNISDVVLDAEKIKNINVWRGTPDSLFELFFSEKLVEKFKENKISSLEYTKINVR